MIKFILPIVSVMLFTSCSHLNNTTVAKINQEPKWLMNPYITNDNIAAVGCAQIHFKGVSAQKDLAISRAVDRIAEQNKITVENITYRQRNSSNGKRGNSSTSSSSLHKVDNIQLSTKIKAIYKKNDGEICAWVVQK